MAEPPTIDIGVVLLVDPDSTTRLTHAAALRAEGLYVEEHSDAVSALTRAPTIKPNLVITELRLRSMDGAGLCRALRLDPNTRDTAVVALTSDPEEAAQQQKAKFDLVLAKPIPIDRLVRETKYLVSLSACLRQRSDQIIARAGELPEASLALRARRAALADSGRFCPGCRSHLVESVAAGRADGWWRCSDCGHYWRVED